MALAVDQTCDLRGQVALVTGASSGLGWRFSRVLAAAGAEVVLTGRRTDRLEELAALIRADGGSAVPVGLDVSDSEAVVTTLEHIHESVGLVRILINNAGIPDGERAERMPVDLIDRVLATNLRGPYLLSCEVARRLIDAHAPGRIVMISSMAAFHYTEATGALYAITKSALVRMSETLAVEWARRSINVNCMVPGAFESEMLDRLVARVGDLSQGFPRRRIGSPDRLDSTLLYLCAPHNECVTGAVIKIDDAQFPR